MPRYQMIIGRSEEVDIVDTALSIPAKIDTGAFRSSIHAKNIKVVEKDGLNVLTFKILGHPCAAISRDLEATEFEIVNIRSSNGAEESRYAVKLKIKLGSKIYKTSFSLADRSNNLFPILIGREALKNRFMIDVSRSSVNYESMLKDFGVKRPRDEEDLEG